MLKIKKTTKKIFIKITISNLLIQRTFQNQCKARRTKKKKKQLTFLKLLHTFAAAKRLMEFSMTYFFVGNQFCPPKWRF